MDAKITKKRLSGLLFYDWMILVAIIVAIILVWEVIFAVSSVRVTTGQSFYYYYDIGVNGNDDTKLRSMLKDDEALSFNIITLDREAITWDSDFLNTRLQVQDGDIIFCAKTDVEGASNRAQWLVETAYAYRFDALVADAKSYLNNFYNEQGEFDDQKIERHFLTRMKGDNRFRTDEQKKEGIKKEKARLIKLQSDLFDFETKILTNEDIIYKSKRTEQTQLYDFGIDLGKLSEEKYSNSEKIDITQFVTLENTGKAQNIVLMAINFVGYQQDEQFEVLGFINSIVRNCSTILD